MTTALGSVAAGAILALVAIFGGVAAISPSANSAAKSERVVIYDAP
ncbi:hypothetical protein [Knoellia subterranea]|uniref:Uncharacterized protein n=1 Tax=Knoellia subterranea KCTC 19937 TaxID=1385521 RepID=A0A0A0JN64_9MICO|nr:hypothetical protein [Knoellia subterranea]KGN38885.1 hypothetical protein N803_08785 [Knoellia subterranea KCTC 19937]